MHFLDDRFKVLESPRSIRNGHLETSVPGHIILHQLDELGALFIPEGHDHVSLRTGKSLQFPLSEDGDILVFLFQFFLSAVSRS